MPFARELRMITHAIVDSTGSRSQLPKIQFINARYFSKYYFGLPAIRKSVLPYLMLQPSLPIHTQVLDRNMALKKNDGENKNLVKNTTKRPLVVILAWMMAKTKHLDKYSKIYSDRGYDVLIVSLSPMDMLFPKSGSQVVASNFLQFLKQHGEYDQILIHGFSVGAYLFGEAVVKLNHEPQFKELSKKIVGMIFDSAVDFEGIPKGFPRAMTRNPLMVRMLEWYTSTHLRVMYETATKHYIKASEEFHYKMPIKCPVLLLVSHDDLVGNPAMNQRLAENWKNSGMDVTFKCWDHSGHCGHMLKYPEEYLQSLEQFLRVTDLEAKSNL